jgi:hypothetical protein
MNLGEQLCGTSSQQRAWTFMERFVVHTELANGIGIVHALHRGTTRITWSLTTPPIWAVNHVDSLRRWVWMGAADARCRFVEHELAARRVIASVMRALVTSLLDSGAAAEIDMLPCAPGTGDLQLKNVVRYGGPSSDAIAPVNIEILVRMPRVWDLCWLLLMTDDAVGLRGVTEKMDGGLWLDEFAVAMRVWRMHNGGAPPLTESKKCPCFRSARN